MILACPQCSRQYKVDQYPPGKRVRCLCGQAMTVPEPQPHEARMLHCADCGAPLAANARTCEYCGGVLDPNQRHYSLICPRCFARLPDGARFCIECATPIRPQEVVAHAESTHRCPRCDVALQARGAEGIPFEECPECLGLWLGSDAFKDICQRKTEEYRENPLPGRTRADAPLEPVVYLKCPECRQVMNRQNFGKRSGIIIDRCAEHGLWLDDTELERIARFIADGGLAQARQSEADRLSREASRAAARASSSSSLGAVLSTDVSSSWGFLGVLGSLFDD